MQNWFDGKRNEFISFQDLNTWFETLINDLNKTIIQRAQEIRENILLVHLGNMYQIKLLLWYLVRGASKHYNSFRLSTQLKQVKKFDDIIFKYVENGKEIYRLVQAKHKKDQNKKLKLKNDLLTLQRNGDFSLLKYLRSYQELKKEEMFQKGEIQDFVFLLILILISRRKLPYTAVKKQQLKIL